MSMLYMHTLALLFALSLCGCIRKTTPPPIETAPIASDGRIAAELLREDTRQLVSILESSHPDPFLRGGGRVAFMRRVDEVMRAIPPQGATTEEFRALVAPLVASVRDGHTSIAPGPSTGTSGGLWIDLEPIEQDLFVSGVYRPEDRNLLGARLLAIGGVDVAELLRRMSTLRGYDNEMHNRVNLVQALRNGAMHGPLVGSVNEGIAVRVGCRANTA